jgi:hypothetical protein
MLNLFDTFSLKYLAESFKPFSLSPIGRPTHFTRQPKIIYERSGGWLGPWLMGSTNAQIVGRTYGLLNGSWGDKFSYKEYRRYESWFRSYAWAFGLAILGPVFMIPPFRWLMRFFNRPGEGPTDEMLDNSYFRIKISAVTDEEIPREGSIIVHGDKDPAYLLTGI